LKINNTETTRMSVMEARELLRNIKDEHRKDEVYTNENVCCLNSLLAVKMSGSTHTANTAISSTAGRKSGIEGQDQSKEEEYSPDPLIMETTQGIPKSVEEERGSFLKLLEGRSLKSNSDKQHNKQA
jgi:hypothetical protein